MDEDIDTIDDSKWRNSISLLECNSKIYDLRTDKFKHTLDNIISETEKENNKFIKRRGENEDILRQEEFDRVFHDGNETVVRNEEELEMNQVDYGFEKDPMMNHLSGQFQEGKSDSLFFYNLDVI